MSGTSLFTLHLVLTPKAKNRFILTWNENFEFFLYLLNFNIGEFSSFFFKYHFILATNIIFNRKKFKLPLKYLVNTKSLTRRRRPRRSGGGYGAPHAHAGGDRGGEAQAN